MNKYVIELRPDCKVVQEICESDGKVSIGAKSVNYLEELNSDYINEHFGDLQDTAYQKGFEDGKAVNDKRCEGCMYQDNTIEHHPCGVCCNAYHNQWTAKNDKIEVGDEVKHKSEGVTWTAIVTRISCGMLTLMGHSGASADNYPIEDFVKTGRHFDIQSILEEMRHD